MGVVVVVVVVVVGVVVGVVLTFVVVENGVFGVVVSQGRGAPVGKVKIVTCLFPGFFVVKKAGFP